MDVSIYVSQSGLSFEVNTSLLNFEDIASTQSVLVETLGSWCSTTPDSWISVSLKTITGDNELNITVNENTTHDEE